MSLKTFAFVAVGIFIAIGVGLIGCNPPTPQPTPIEHFAPAQAAPASNSCSAPSTHFCGGCQISCPANKAAYCTPGQDSGGDCDRFQCYCARQPSCQCQ